MSKAGKYNWRTSPVAQRIIAILEVRPCGINSLAKLAFTGPDHARRLIRLMRADPEAKARIVRWVRGTSGPISPVYRWQDGPDAPRPAPLTTAEICRRYRRALRRKHGPIYKEIHAAMKRHQPGRTIVSAGEVVYSCN